MNFCDIKHCKISQTLKAPYPAEGLPLKSLALAVLGQEKSPSLAEGVWGWVFCVVKSLNLKKCLNFRRNLKAKTKLQICGARVAHERNSKLKFRSLIAFSLQFLLRATRLATASRNTLFLRLVFLLVGTFKAVALNLTPACVIWGDTIKPPHFCFVLRTRNPLGAEMGLGVGIAEHKKLTTEYRLYFD